jgi:hypothetical protein
MIERERKMTNQNLVIKIIHKNLFGKDFYYPVCEKGRILLKLAGGKPAFNQNEVNLLHQIGYELEMADRF